MKKKEFAKKTYFVSGTDTEIGKTTVSAAILHYYQELGKKTIGLKPVASGGIILDNTFLQQITNKKQMLLKNNIDEQSIYLQDNNLNKADKMKENLALDSLQCKKNTSSIKSIDALILQKLTNIPLSYQEINYFCLNAPFSPSYAAELENKEIRIAPIVEQIKKTMQLNYDLMLIEGAGGWFAPCNKKEYINAIAHQLNLPVIMVVGIKLGCINHALLTQNAIKQQGLTIKGWVANFVSDWNDNFYSVDYLREKIDAPCLGVVPKTNINSGLDQLSKEIKLAQEISKFISPIYNNLDV